MSKAKKLIAFLKRETVLSIALLLAVFSSFFVPPDERYMEYIDFRTLAILFCLMAVMAGLRNIGLFERIARGLLGKMKSVLGLILILTMFCFFFSMLITNDVALITFVPFTFTVLAMLGEEIKKKLVLTVVAMQTIGANLGSMLTPIGNPQNLYLFGKSGMTMGEFTLLMLPYTLFSLVLLLGWGVISGMRFRKTKCQEATRLDKDTEPEHPMEAPRRGLLIAYLLLFVCCLLSVAHWLPWQAALAIVFLAVFLLDRSVLKQVDYALLFTFAGFFVFIGNMGRIPLFSDFLRGIILGREVYTSVIASQVLSNVPAALLLSGFTKDYESLIIGTNLGGLGTLIASMASLISYKYIIKEEESSKGAYIGIFTIANLLFLAALLLLYRFCTG